MHSSQSLHSPVEVSKSVSQSDRLPVSPCSENTYHLGECSSVDTYKVLFTQSFSTVAIIDTGCSKDVCGSSFVNGYFEELRLRGVSFKEKRKHGGLRFSFANGEFKYSDYRVYIPIHFGNKIFNIEVNVFDGIDLPLLLSRY